jgi:hypothetical protein
LAWLLVCVAGAGAAEAPQLIPFQGRLTDQQGQVYADGQFSVLFQIYDEPVGGTALWSERHEKVGVMNGMLNVFLGSIQPLTKVEFSQTRHLGITIDADNNPNTPDPEMLPRQMIIPAFWARQSDNSTRLAGHDWTPLFGVNNPTGPLPGTKLQAGSITAAQIAPLTITSNQMAAGSVTGKQVVSGTLQSSHFSSQLAADSMIPPGTIIAFGGEAVPPGWLLCDGRALKRADYGRLWDAVGTRWGNGTTGVNAEPVAGHDFNLPDLRGTFLRGVSGGSNRDPDANTRFVNRVGGQTGNKVGTIQGDDTRAISDIWLWSGSEFNRGFFPGPSYDGRGSTQNRPSSWPQGAETRPKNASVHFIIKH